jgi:hypothetical protein
MRETLDIYVPTSCHENGAVVFEGLYVALWFRNQLVYVLGRIGIGDRFVYPYLALSQSGAVMQMRAFIHVVSPLSPTICAHQGELAKGVYARLVRSVCGAPPSKCNWILGPRGDRGHRRRNIG